MENLQSGCPDQPPVGPPKPIPELPHILVFLDQVQEEQINGGAIHPIRSFLVANGHQNFCALHEVEDPAFFDLECGARTEKNDPMGKPFAHEFSYGFQFGLRSGHDDSARKAVKGEIENAVAVSAGHDSQVVLQLFNGVAR